MKTYIIPESKIEQYRQAILANKLSCIEESKIKLGIMGIEEIDIEEAKKIIKIGESLLVNYNGQLVPMQCIHKYDDGRVALQSYYLLEQHEFDQNTNVYKDSEIRRYLNGDFLNKFDPSFVEMLKTTDVHTDDYVTYDKMWLLSHEEIGYFDDSHMFKPNVGSVAYDYYRQISDEKSNEDFKEVC